MLSNKSIAFKLTLVITLCSTCIFASLLGYNYYRSRLVLRKELVRNARNLTMASVNRIETVLTAVTKVAEGVARSLENTRPTREELSSLLRSTLAENPEIYGCGAAFDPHATGPDSHPYITYFQRDHGRIVYAPDDTLNYLQKDWYQISRETGKKEWTEPYYEGNVLMATCSVPFYETTDGARRLKGVAFSNVSLDWLTELVASIKVLKNGYAFLISRYGTIVTHPDRAMIMNVTIFGFAEAAKDPTLRELGRKMIKGGSDFIPFTNLKGVKCWVYYAPIPSTGWSLAVVFPETELLDQVKTLSLTGALIGLGGIMLLTMAVVLIARSITFPLKTLAGATTAIARGDFDVELPPVSTQDEVGKLADAFAAMKSSLKEYIKRLTETTAAKERIESELRIARDIQRDFLPRTFPPFPDRQEFELYAVMEPAKEVAGDFYDFFFVDDTHLCFVIADVSGKGVPAALFMAMSLTLIKATARYGLPPEEILCRVNNVLARENDSCMFVTAFLGILDTESGEVIYANGGHNPPLHLKHGGGVAWPARSGSLMVGVMEDAPYRCERILLEPGDCLFLYTDGVNEAINAREEAFSNDRLERRLRALQGYEIKDVVFGIMADVRAFTGEAPQFDDITMMVIQYRGE